MHNKYLTCASHYVYMHMFRTYVHLCDAYAYIYIYLHKYLPFHWYTYLNVYIFLALGSPTYAGSIFRKLSSNHRPTSQFYHRRAQNRKLGTSTTAPTVNLYICIRSFVRGFPLHAHVYIITRGHISGSLCRGPVEIVQNPDGSRVSINPALPH